MLEGLSPLLGADHKQKRYKREQRGWIMAALRLETGRRGVPMKPGSSYSSLKLMPIPTAAPTYPAPDARIRT